MRLTSRSAKHVSKLDLPLTSMIDVVFLLLIYFLVTSSLVKEERELDAGIQVRRTTASGVSDLAPTIIRIVPGGGGFVYQVGGREFASQAELTRVLAQLENKIEMAYVSPDDDAPYDMAAAAIQALKDARYPNVIYAPPDASR